MPISIANFSQMVTDIANIAIDKKYKVAFPLAYLHLTFARSKVQVELKLKFKVMYPNSTVNISQKVIDRANIAISNK